MDEVSTGWKIWPDNFSFTRNRLVFSLCLHGVDKPVSFTISGFYYLPMRRARLPKWRLQAELPLLDGHGIHTMPVKFSALSVKKIDLHVVQYFPLFFSYRILGIPQAA